MSIRTTITLDDDVYEKLKRASASKGESFRDVVNDVIRRGLLSQDQAEVEPPVQIAPLSMGTPKIPLGKLGEVLEFLEGPMHR